MEIFGTYFSPNSLILMYILHIIISSVLALIVTIYIRRRYESKSKEAQANDRKRLARIANRSLFFKALFQISLHKYNPIASFLFFFLFNLSVPVFGYLATIWVAYYLVHVKYKNKVVTTNILNLDEFQVSFLEVERIFGEGSMSNIITEEDVPKSKKLKALSTLSSNISPSTLRIIKQTLSSKNDEIRMYGYAIINKTEKRLNEDINRYLEIYNDKTADEATRAEAAKELAYFYWEMVYTELSHESLRESFMKEVLDYIHIAKIYYAKEIRNYNEEMAEVEKELNNLRYNQNQDRTLNHNVKIEELETELEILQEKRKASKDTNAKLHILKGRVHMLKKEYDMAVQEFTIAQEMSESDSSFVLPYLAEIYFILRKFNVAKAIMNKTHSLDLNPKLYPIVAQWRSEKW